MDPSVLDELRSILERTCAEYLASSAIVAICVKPDGAHARRRFAAGEAPEMASFLVQTKSDDDEVFIYKDDVDPGPDNWIGRFVPGMQAHFQRLSETQSPPRIPYQAFLEDFLQAETYELRKDGVPLHLLDELSAEEKKRAESALIERLVKTNDNWPVEGLAHLKSQKAVSHLRELLPNADNVRSAALAAALWQITEDEHQLEVVLRASIDSYQNKDRQAQTYDMIDIIYYLAEFPHTIATDRLKELTKSRNYLISYNAKRALTARDNS